MTAKRGHLAVLQWARENGCPWDEHTCSAAVSAGQLAVLQWARQKGCPWNKRDCLQSARRRRYSTVAAWIEKN